MAWSVSEDNCILCLRIDGISQSAQIATSSSPKIMYIVLSLPIPILKYLEQYVRSTPKVVQKLLH
jgi:hypothetical protein